MKKCGKEKCPNEVTHLVRAGDEYCFRVCKAHIPDASDQIRDFGGKDVVISVDEVKDESAVAG